MLQQNNGDNSTNYQAENMTVHVYEHYPNKMSIIAEVVNILATSINFDELPEISANLPLEVRKKIEHNNIQQSKHIIESYKDYVLDLEKAYNILEQETPNANKKVLKIINTLYKSKIASLTIDNNSSVIDLIRTISDNIINEIIASLKDTVFASKNLSAYSEDVDISINLIVADAFIKCLILENPNKETILS